MIEFAQSFSTLLFLICTLILGSAMPTNPGETTAVFAAINEKSSDFTLEGEWESFGVRYRFTDKKLTVGEETYAYTLEDGMLILTHKDKKRAISIEIHSDESITLGGIPLFRIS